MSTQDRFDEAIRAAHAQSLDHVSPRVRAQLAQRRRTALSGQARAIPWRFALPIAAACAMGAVAIGLQFRVPAPAPVVATVTPKPTPTVSEIVLAQSDDTAEYAALEESPEMYAWLASDGAALAMEQRR
jgi:hypothetical protein